MLYYLSLVAVLAFGLVIANPLAPPAKFGDKPFPNGSCPFPNGTDKAIYSYMCADNEQFTITDIQVTDKNSNPIYPVDPRQEFILNLTTYNHGQQIDDNHVKVKIYQYETTYYSKEVCVWADVPTFGLLNNIDGCDFAHNCPLTSGPLFLILPLDLSQFSAIINVLAAYKPYQLEIRMYNYNSGNTKHEEIACVMAQVELS
ncbi:hypothetical protein WR25_23285 [Diploscapter pachys]|uniref:MD-2-related lipid-recognition domain-containing protein n=1 Tax=Diploscapter pachys TaxID=2018661 RepID=A0A2A2J7M4_9BILA|nr:hypothetical protein WR25_23285 [Diploscapter pachys]